MKITKEIKTAILVISSILLFIWGYSFLKGRDLLTNYQTYYVQYSNIEGLAVSAPITINGLIVGKVIGFKINNQTGKIDVELQIKPDYFVSKSSKAELYASSLLGGKQIAILVDLNDKVPAENGQFLLPATKLAMTDELAGQVKPLTEKFDKVLGNANDMLVNINEILDEKTKQNLKNSLANLNETLAEFKLASQKVNGILADNKEKIDGTLTNFNKMSVNFTKLSDSLAKINLGKTVQKLDKTLASVDKIMFDIQSGKGTMGKLMKDEALYNNFAKSSKELELLLQDLRLNPTRYVNVSLFGKKNKPYVAPKNDTLK